jgi:hypothetical protein
MVPRLRAWKLQRKDLHRHAPASVWLWPMIVRFGVSDNGRWRALSRDMLGRHQ